MLAKTAQLVRGKDGKERVIIDLAEFQALLDAANEPKHQVPGTKAIVDELRRIFESDDEYVDADDFLARYDAAHDSR